MSHNYIILLLVDVKLIKFEVVEMAGVEPASKTSPIVVIHKFSQFLSAPDKIDGHKISLTILLQ